MNRIRFLLCVMPCVFIALGYASESQILRVTEDGILFEAKSSGADTVYLAGSFNNWADNAEGDVRDDRFAMKRGKGDVWTKTLKLEPGRYAFKFVQENGVGDEWFVSDGISSVDDEGNVLFTVVGSGAVFLGDGINPDLCPRVEKNTVTFQMWAPDAGMVYLAGDFNNWAENKEGFVSSVSAQMDGPDEGGIWRKTLTLVPGPHHYQFVIDGERWIRDANENEFLDDHSIVTVIQ